MGIEWSQNFKNILAGSISHWAALHEVMACSLLTSLGDEG
jgi:hypothetical protein